MYIFFFHARFNQSVVLLRQLSIFPDLTHRHTNTHRAARWSHCLHFTVCLRCLTRDVKATQILVSCTWLFTCSPASVLSSSPALWGRKNAMKQTVAAANRDKCTFIGFLQRPVRPVSPFWVTWKWQNSDFFSSFLPPPQKEMELKKCLSQFIWFFNNIQHFGKSLALCMAFVFDAIVHVTFHLLYSFTLKSYPPYYRTLHTREKTKPTNLIKSRTETTHTQIKVSSNYESLNYEEGKKILDTWHRIIEIFNRLKGLIRSAIMALSQLQNQLRFYFLLQETEGSR